MADLIIPFITAILGGMIWGLRLEGKVKSAEETSSLRMENMTIRQSKFESNQEDLKHKIEALNDKILEKLLTIEKQLSKFEGRFLTNEHRHT